MAFELETAKKVVIDGETVAVTNKAELITAIKASMKDAGLGKAKVYVNGVEVESDEALNFDNISEGANIELKPYDKAM